MSKGIFITFEGGEGAGKSTVLLMVEKELRKMGQDVIATREPGGSVIAEKIREVILDPRHTEMDSRTEALLYAAARRQHLTETVLPQLSKGGIVLCDRFVDSSIVYQGFARGIGTKEVRELNLFATDGVEPDVTFLFDLDPREGLARIGKNSGREFNRLDQESLKFHEDVRKAYLAIHDNEPKRVIRVDASKGVEEVYHNVLEHVLRYLG